MKKIVRSFITSLVASSSLVASPKAVVFDFGGVMTGNPNREVVVHFIKNTLHLSQAEFEKANQEKHLAIKLGKTDAEFWISYAKEKKIELPIDWKESFQEVVKKAIGINSEMYMLVDELKEQKILVAMLSNIDQRFAQFVREFGLYKPFEPCLLSCETGAEKPDLKAYEVLLQTLKLQAKEIVFIDDMIENVEAAKALGIDAILFESAEQIRKELKIRGVEQGVFL